MPADDLHYSELVEIGRLIQKRELSSVAATQSQLNRITQLDGQLKSYAYVMATSALEQAKAADLEIAAGKVRGPLHGVPIAVKDLCWTKDAPTAAGMKTYRDIARRKMRQLLSPAEAGAVSSAAALTEGAYADQSGSRSTSQSGCRAWARPRAVGVATAAGLCHACFLTPGFDPLSVGCHAAPA